MLMALQVACGGQAQGDLQHEPTSRAGAGGSKSLPSTGTAGGAGGIESDTGAAGQVIENGAAASGESMAHGGEPNGGAAAVPLIASGSRLCVDERDCLGLECVGATGLSTLTCAVRCPQGEECTADQSCIDSPLLEPICLHRCDSPTQCESLYDCFDAKKTGDYVCTPPAWTRGWQ